MPDLDLRPGWLKRDALSAAVSVAWDKLRQTKRQMDEAQAVFEKAENEWHEACLEHDRAEAEQQQAYSSTTLTSEKKP